MDEALIKIMSVIDDEEVRNKYNINEYEYNELCKLIANEKYNIDRIKLIKRIYYIYNDKIKFFLLIIISHFILNNTMVIRRIEIFSCLVQIIWNFSICQIYAVIIKLFNVIFEGMKCF